MSCLEFFLRITLSRIPRFAEVLTEGIALATASDTIVVFGIPPTRPETGFGYIELGADIQGDGPVQAGRMRRFTEKPVAKEAAAFLKLVIRIELRKFHLVC
jgi:mannose-1-phosphate guanylyltransferase